MEGHPGKSFWRTIQSWVDLSGNFAGAVRRWLHHWAAHRFDHVCRRRARLPGADSGDQVFRSRNDDTAGAGNGSHQRDESVANSRRVRFVHRRGRRSRWWNHQLVPIAANDLARIERRPRGSSRRSKVDGRRAAHRSRHVDESRHGRHYRADRFDHAVPTVESSVQSDWRNSDRRVWLFVRNRVVAPDRRDWFLFESDLRHDRRDATAHMPDLFSDWLDGAELLHHRAIDWRHRLHRFFKWWHNFAGSEDGIPDWLDAEASADRHPRRRVCVSVDTGSDPACAERLSHG